MAWNPVNFDQPSRYTLGLRSALVDAGIAVYNLYGVTEQSVWAACGRVDDGPACFGVRHVWW